MLQRKRGQGSARTATESVSLGSEAEDSINKLVLASDGTLLHPPHLALPNVVHHLVALLRSPLRSELPKVLLGTDLFLDGAVILLQNVIQILNWPRTATWSQDTFLLGFRNCVRITLGFVGVDHPRFGVRRVWKGFGKQRLGRIGGTQR